MNPGHKSTVSSSAQAHRQVSVSKRSVTRTTFISSITGASQLAIRPWSIHSKVNLLQQVPLILWSEPDPVYLFCIATYLHFFTFTYNDVEAVLFFFHTVTILTCFLDTMTLNRYYSFLQFRTFCSLFFDFYILC